MKLTVFRAYWIAFSILAAWATIAFLTMSTLINSQEQYGNLINLSGKQRMLSQKNAYYAHLVYANQSKMERLKIFIQEMKRDYDFIAKNLPSKELHNYYFDKNGLDYKVKEYFNLLDNFTIEPTKHNLKQIAKAAQPLLIQLNEAVSIF